MLYLAMAWGLWTVLAMYRWSHRRWRWAMTWANILMYFILTILALEYTVPQE